MTANQLDVPKGYQDGNPLFEANLDDAFNSIEEWGLSVNYNVQQIALDCFGSSYSLDNDGSANRATPLVDSLAALDEAETITGAWTFNNDVKIITGYDLLMYSDA